MMFSGAILLFTALTNECGTAGDRQAEARAYFYWGFYPPFIPATTPKRIEYFQKAAALYHDLKNTEAVINAITDAGYLLVTTFQLDKVI